MKLVLVDKVKILDGIFLIYRDILTNELYGMPETKNSPTEKRVLLQKMYIKGDKFESNESGIVVNVNKIEYDGAILEVKLEVDKDLRNIEVVVLKLNDPNIPRVIRVVSMCKSNKSNKSINKSKSSKSKSSKSKSKSNRLFDEIDLKKILGCSGPSGELLKTLHNSGGGAVRKSVVKGGRREFLLGRISYLEEQKNNLIDENEKNNIDNEIRNLMDHLNRLNGVGKKSKAKANTKAKAKAKANTKAKKNKQSKKNKRK
jgi:hypothetical protein